MPRSDVVCCSPSSSVRVLCLCVCARARLPAGVLVVSLPPCVKQRAMQELQAAGKTRAIGVSNFTITHLKELIDDPGINNFLTDSVFFSRTDFIGYR